MSLEKCCDLAKVTIQFACGEVTLVTAESLHCITDDGKPVPGTGRYEDVDVPLDSPALKVLLGTINLALLARATEAEARVAVLEAAAAEAVPAE